MVAKRRQHIRRQWGRDYLPDDRDRGFQLASRRRILKKTHQWKLGQVTDQGQTSQCVGHAWHNWLASEPMPQVPMLPAGIYFLAQHYDEWDGTEYDGTSVRGAAKMLSLTGHVETYHWAWDVDTAVHHVMTISPLVLGCTWYVGMNGTDANGFIYPRGRAQGGHATLIYGAHIPEKYVMIRNSWGDRWGQRGNCKIRFSDLQKLLSANGECCTAIESLPGG
jgi:hypothetical protein